MKSRLFLVILLSVAVLQMSAITFVRKIDGVYYNFDTSTMTVTFVNGLGANTNRTEFKGTSLHVPDKMEFEGETYTFSNIGNAFQGCQTLETLTFDPVVHFTDIALWAFAQCPKLKEVTVPEGVTVLGADRAFGSNESLEEVTLPKTIKTIGGWSFYDDPALKVVHIKSPIPPTIGTSAFGGRTNCVIAVPDAALDTYLKSNIWKSYNIMSETAYNNPSYKKQLELYYSSKQSEINAIRAGKTPDKYPADMVQAVQDAKLNIDTLLQGDYADSLYINAVSMMDEAIANAYASFNPITTGYYNIVCGYPAFYNNQKKYKAMMTTTTSNLGWGNYDDMASSQIFYVEKQEDGTFTIRNYGNGNYVTGANSDNQGTNIQTNANNSASLVVTSLGKLQWSITNDGYTRVFAPSGSASGTGVSGVISLLAPTEADGENGWRFVPVHQSVVDVLDEAKEIQQRYKTLQNMHAEAEALCKKTIVYTMNSTKLLTSESQLSSNAQSATEGTLKALIDGQSSGTVYFHSTYGTPADPGVPHYIQAELNTPIRGFIGMISRRSGAYGLADAPTLINIYGSNDAMNWEFKEQYSTTWEANKAGLKTTGLIFLKDEYKYLRFEVVETIENRNNGYSHPYFSLAELQLYEAKINTEESLYYDAIGMEEAVESLKSLIAEQMELLEFGYVDQRDIDELQQAIDEVQAIIDNPISAVNSVVTDNGNNTANAYDIYGHKVSADTKGIIIVNGKKIKN